MNGKTACFVTRIKLRWTFGNATTEERVRYLTRDYTKGTTSTYTNMEADFRYTCLRNSIEVKKHCGVALISGRKDPRCRFV